MKKMFFLMLTLMVLSAASMNAQVTIGSTEVPTKGAVLDLSKVPLDSNLGLILPRVALTDITKYQLGGDDTKDLTSYPAAAGAIVYNTGGSLAPGIYVWTDSGWLAYSTYDPLAPSSINITPSSHSFSDFSATEQLSATVLPVGSDQSVTWNSLNMGVAIVDATGLVTPIANGNTTIQAISTVDPTVIGTAQINVSVLGAPYSLNIIVGTFGSIAGSTPNGNYLSGTDVTATGTPNPDCSFDNWYANGIRIADADAAHEAYLLKMPDSNLLLQPNILGSQQTCELTGGAWIFPGTCLANGRNLIQSSTNQADCASNSGVWNGTCLLPQAAYIANQTDCETMRYRWENNKCVNPVSCQDIPDKDLCPLSTMKGGCKWTAAGGCLPRTECSDYLEQSECPRKIGSSTCKWTEGACVMRP